jgi:hypothetical protein
VIELTDLLFASNVDFSVAGNADICGTSTKGRKARPAMPCWGGAAVMPIGIS